MGNVVMVPENLMAISGATVEAGSEASASMEKENLLSEVVSKFWRSSGTTPDKAWFSLSLNGYEFSSSAVGLIGHNLYRGDEYSIDAYNTGGYDSSGQIAYGANAIIASTNRTGAVSTVQGGYTPSGTWMTPTTVGSAWDVTLNFTGPVLVGGGASGTRMHAFWIFVKTNAAAAYAVARRSVHCELYEDVAGTPTFRADLGSKFITSLTGQWMFFSFDDSTIAGGTAGSKLLCKLSFDANGGANYSSAGCATLSYGDALVTWQVYDPFVGSGIIYEPQAQPGSGGTILKTYTIMSDTDYVTVRFRSDFTPTDLVATREAPPTPPGYVQVGTAVVGEQWSPTVNISYGKLVGGVDTSPKRRTYGGQLFGSRRPVRRVVSLKLGHLTPDECHTLFDRIVWRHGGMKPFLISLLPDDATQSKHTTIFGALRNPENWVNIQPEQGYENNMEMDFEEVL